MSQSSPNPNCSESVRQVHELYCRQTAQHLALRFDRERLWYEFLRAGFTPADLERVISYLQKEIRAQRRNVGALKLSNLLQLDRFEEDLNISRVRLHSPPKPRPNTAHTPSDPAPADEAQRQRMVHQLRSFHRQLRGDP
jgi:hypothetical protein